MNVSRERIQIYIPLKIIDLIKYIFRMGSMIIGKYETYNDVPKFSNGYSDEELISDAANKTELHKDHLQNSTALLINEIDAEILASFSGLLSLSREIKVLDFGGSFGKYYFFVQKIFGDNIKMAWDVFETKSLCEMSGSYAAFQAINYFSDFDNIKENRYDIVIASGSVQYFQDPIKVIKDLANLQSKVLIINRMPLIDTPTQFSLQKLNLQDNGPLRSVDSKKVFKRFQFV